MADFQWDEDPLAQLGEITPHPVRSPSESSEPLSSAHGSVIAETAKAVANNVLLDYKPIHNSDDTVKVLQAFLDNLSGPGLGTLCNDIYAIKDKQRLLRQLRNFLVDAILKPMAAAGGREPPVTPPPNESAARDIEYAMPTIEGSSRTDHHWLKQQCLDRDGGRCLLTGAIDTDRYGRMAPGERKGARHARTQCAHLLPFALSKLNKRSATHVKNKATIWWALYQYFPALRGKIAANTVNQPGNAVMLSAAIHQDFGLFAFGFRSMEEQHKYHIEILDEDSFYAAQFPTTTTFPQHDPAVPRPDPDILDVHLRIGRILKCVGNRRSCLCQRVGRGNVIVALLWPERHITFTWPKQGYWNGKCTSVVRQVAIEELLLLSHSMFKQRGHNQITCAQFRPIQKAFHPSTLNALISAGQRRYMWLPSSS